MYTKFISKNIQEKLKAKERALARKPLSANEQAAGKLNISDLASRSVFVRMCSNKVDGIDNILISGGEHKKGGGIPFGFSETYRNIFEVTGETEVRKGIKGIPGIKDISVEYKGGFKAIREATINWSVPAIEYLDELTPYFLTVGKTVVLDWGWTYANKKTLQQQLGGVTPFIFSEEKGDGTVRYMIDQEIFTNPQKKILQAGGDYDAIGGRIKNFNYSLREDGGFDCVTIITALGSALFHKPIDIRGDIKSVKKTTDDGKGAFAPSDTLTNCMLNLRSILLHDIFDVKPFVLEGKFGDVNKGLYEAQAIFGKVTNKATEFMNSSKASAVTVLDYENGYGIAADSKKNPNILALVNDKTIEFMVTWGWFEDQILNRYFSYQGGSEDGSGIKMTMRSIDTVVNENGEIVTLGKLNQDMEAAEAETAAEFDKMMAMSEEELDAYIDENDTTSEAPSYKKYNLDKKEINSLKHPTDSLKRPTTIRNPGLLYPVNPFKFSILETNSLVAGARKSEISGYSPFYLAILSSGITDKLKSLDKFFKAWLKLTNNPNGFQFSKKRFSPKDDKTKSGRLRNIFVNIKEIQKAFGIKNPDDTKDNTNSNVNPPGTIQKGVENLLSALNSNFHNIWNFEMVVDSYDTTNVKVIDKTDSEEKYPVYTNFENNSSNVSELGLYQFPSFKIGSIVKSQNLEFKIPDAQALTILYGANKRKGESDSQQNDSRLDKLFRLDKSLVEVDGRQLNIYSDKFLSNLDTANMKTIEEQADAAIAEAEALLSGKEAPKVKPIPVGSENSNANSKIVRNDFGININPETQKYTWRIFTPDLPGMVKSETDGEAEVVEAYEIVEDNEGKNQLRYVTRKNGQVITTFQGKKSYYTYDKDTKQLTLNPPAASTLNSFLNASSPVAQFDMNSLVPTELLLEIDGTAGILPGDLIHTDYIQNKYKTSIKQVYGGNTKERGPVAYFQLFGITQTIDSSGWKTELKTKMRINQLPAEGALEYEVPEIIYKGDEASNTSVVDAPPERPFIEVPSAEEDIAEDLTLDELDFDDFSDLEPVPPPPHLDPKNPEKDFRPKYNLPSDDEDIAEDLTIDKLDFDDFSNLPKPGPYVPPLEIRRAKQEIALNPEKVPGGLVPPDKQINLDFEFNFDDIPPDNLGKRVGNYSDASYYEPEPKPETKPIEPSAKIKKKPEDKDPETLKEQIDNQKVIFVQPDPKVPENKKQEFPKKQKVEEPIIPKLDWDKPEEVVKKVNDNIKKEEPKEIEVVVLPKEEITILQSTYQRKELPFEVKYAQNEVLYSVREDWRPLYLTGNSSTPLSGARKNSDGTERTLVRAAIPKAVRQEFFDRYIENPNKTGISKVNTTNYRFDATPIENAGLLRKQRSIYWYGEWNPDY